MGLLEKLFGKVKKAPLLKPSQNISIKTSTISTGYEVERFIAEKCIITHLDLDGYVCPSGGFVNWSLFEIVGKNQQTNRKNRRRYEAKTQEQAEQLALDDGLIGPFEVSVLQHAAPTEKQLEYLLSWNVPLPNGASKYDVTSMLSRLEDSEDVVKERQTGPHKMTEWIRPVAGPSEGFAKYSDDMGVRFSLYTGKQALFIHTVSSLNDRERAAFFAYCVLCAQSGTEPGDLRQSNDVGKIYGFADIATGNNAIMRSINSRDANDYLKPHKGSAAYKAVAEYFTL